MRKLTEESYSAVIKTSDCKVLLVKNIKQMYGSSALKWGKKGPINFSLVDLKIRNLEEKAAGHRTDGRIDGTLGPLPWPTSPCQHGLAPVWKPTPELYSRPAPRPITKQDSTLSLPHCALQGQDCPPLHSRTHNSLISGWAALHYL